MKNAVKIPLSRVLAEVCSPGSVFDLAYRKTDGTYGEKKGCLSTPSKSSLTDRRKLNRSGLLQLTQKGFSGIPFNLYIDLLISFNGQVIDHEA